MKMNFKVFKTLIDGIVKSHICKDCGHKCWEDNVEIMWSAWSTVNLNIICPNCEKQHIVRAEISQVQIDSKNLWKNKSAIEKAIKDGIFWGMNLKDLSKEITNIEEKTINDEDIVWFNKEIKNASSIEDLLK